MALAAQKHHYAVYATGVYMDPVEKEKVRNAFLRAGKRPDMGKSGIRFRRLQDLPPGVVGTIAGAYPVEEFIRRYEEAGRGKPGR